MPIGTLMGIKRGTSVNNMRKPVTPAQACNMSNMVLYAVSNDGIE